MANTTRFMIEIPDVGADADMWGTILNNYFNALEPKIFDRSAGDTVSGPLTVTGLTSVTTLNATGVLNTPAVNGATTLRLQTGGVDRVTVDAAGNAGLGVVPSAWGSSYRSLDMQNVGAFFAEATGNVGLGFNTYYSASEVPRYKLGIGAFSYRMSGEGHEWRVAPVGTAGAPITFTQAMTLTTGGNLLVGTNLDAGNRISAQVTSSGVFQGAYTASNGADSDFTVRIRTNETQIANSTGGGVLSFATANSERARITSGGYFKASNTGVYGNAAGLGNNVNGLNHWFQNDQNDTVVVGVSSNTGSVVTSFASYLPSGSTGAHFAGFVNGGSVYRINANGSGGQVSDANLKTNITPATPKLADLNRVEVVTYNWKEDTGIGSQKEIGVIAQQLESVFPALVQTIEKDDGTEQKMVKYSVFVPILIKAVQELSAQNSALTDRIAALEAK